MGRWSNGGRALAALSVMIGRDVIGSSSSSSRQMLVAA
jgi:hypothetical protein